MPRHKAKRSPHSRYRDDPEDNRAGEIDRASLASKSRSVVRVDHDGNDGAFVFEADSGSSSARCKQAGIYLTVVLLVLAAMATQSVEAGPSFVVLCVCVLTLGYAASMAVSLLEQDTGTPKMRRVAGFIQEGAQGFFRTQFTAIAGMALVTGGLAFVGSLRPTPRVKASPFVLSVITTASFAVGALCSLRLALPAYGSQFAPTCAWRLLLADRI